VKKVRLDQLLVERRMAQSRERARALILAGRVRVKGEAARKAGDLVSPDDPIELAEPDHPYVGRGGVKLAHALDAFGIEVDGRTALDIGASTGGFTDVLLRRGARRVVALDVGHGQLAWSLRQDPRVEVIERVNARSLTPELLPSDLRHFGVVTIDVSFISLRYVLPPVPGLLAPDGDVVALVKPQFEAGRDEVESGGIVRDSAVQERAIESVAAAADKVGLRRVAMTPSPIEGMEGNREFFLHFRG
jgi:23S rRNA (cytidine1920-2'-O)/16S rRNA (cytidine1409-2'-O)-methyltransferase